MWGPGLGLRMLTGLGGDLSGTMVADWASGCLVAVLTEPGTTGDGCVCRGHKEQAS